MFSFKPSTLHWELKVNLDSYSKPFNDNDDERWKIVGERESGKWEKDKYQLGVGIFKYI